MVILPVQSDNNEIRYTKIIDLYGRDFIFTFDWNDREQFWYMTVQEIDQTLIRGLVGIKVVVNWQLNRMVRGDQFPKGVLMAYNNTNTDPQFDNLKLGFVLENEI